MSSRQSILSKLPDIHAKPEWPRERLVPGFVKQEHARLVEMFRDKVIAALATTETVASVNDVPAKVAQRYPDADIVVSGVLDNLPWSQVPLQRTALDLTKDGIIAVTDCFAGVAETGTLVLLSDAGRDSRLNFVSQTHIVIVEASSIVGPYEDVWTRLTEANISMPRAVNFITGPSRTADIEQTLELGAHGPGEIHVMIVDPASTAQP
jgi:L-lactate dehydrogenase complex protein LldG